MKGKQTMALFLSAVSSAVVYSEAHAENLIQEEQYVMVPNFGEVAPAAERTIQTFATTEIPVVTTIEELKEIIKKQMNELNGTFKVQYKGDTSNIGEEIMAAIVEVKDQDDYLLGILLRYGFKSYGYQNDLELTFNFTYTTTPEQEKIVKSEVKRLVAELIQPSMSDIEKVKVINEYIVKNTTYSKIAKTSVHAAYAIVSEGKGVCQAYAMLAYMLLKEAGMEVHYVTGFAGEPHAWNLVKVDGEWYHLDPTWSDPTFSFSDSNLADYISYNYFLVSDNVISKDHKIDYRTGLPAATSERFSALRSDMSSLFSLNGIQYYLLPEYVDGYFYYVDYKDKNYPINRINLLAPVPTVETFADVQAMDILATDNSIYFVDVSMFWTDNVFGLSKVDLATKNVTQLFKEQTVTSIKKDSQFVYAYNGTEEVYREPINPVNPGIPVEPEQPTEESIEVTTLITEIEALNENTVSYIENVAALAKKFAALSEIQRLLVTNTAKLMEAQQIASFYQTVIHEIDEAIEALADVQNFNELQVAVKTVRGKIEQGSPAVVAGIKNEAALIEKEKYIAAQLKNQVELEEQKQEINKVLSTIVYLSKDFEMLAQQLRTKLEGLSNSFEQLLDVSLVEKINEVEQKYNKVKNLTFNQTTAWKQKTQVTEVKKSWSVKLSQPLKNTMQNLKNIQVVDMFGDPVDVTVTVEDGNTIRVTPKGEYVEEIPYTLVITADLENEKGVKLNKGTHLTFTFK